MSSQNCASIAARLSSPTGQAAAKCAVLLLIRVAALCGRGVDGTAVRGDLTGVEGRDGHAGVRSGVELPASADLQQPPSRPPQPQLPLRGIAASESGLMAALIGMADLSDASCCDTSNFAGKKSERKCESEEEQSRQEKTVDRTS